MTALWLALCAILGGWEWCAVSLAALALLWRRKPASTGLLVSGALSLLWLLAFRLTGDRRLFFPYAMQVAVQIPVLLAHKMARPSLLGGGAILIVFLVIRIWQAASVEVLAVESIAGAAILFMTNLTGLKSPNIAHHLGAGALGSVLAFAALFI